MRKRDQYHMQIWELQKKTLNILPEVVPKHAIVNTLNWNQTITNKT